MPGFADKGAVLVNETNDGVKLETLWQEIEDVTTLWNKEKTTLSNLISYQTTVPADAVPQSLAGEEFREASEYGVPVGIAPPAPYLKVGYSWVDIDAASRFSWKFLRDASSEQVRSQVTRILEADERYQQRIVLSRLFDDVPGVNDFQHVVYPIWNGDGIVPLSHMGNTFAGSHSHFLVSGSVDIDSGDVEDAMRHVTHHGYGLGGGSGHLLLLVNPAEAESVQSWRAGKENATPKRPASISFRLRTRRRTSRRIPSSVRCRPQTLTACRCSEVTARLGFWKAW